MRSKINWGILGPGKIAHKFAEGMKHVPSAHLYAIASSSLERSKSFAQQYNADVFYGSYQELVEDKNVDIIYIATTNNAHYENVKLCIEQKKNVLCEKPFTLKASELEELIVLAKQNNVFLMEALWTRFLPSIELIDKLLAQNKIGEITGIKADFGFAVPFNAESRLFNPQLGGGALLDIGLYPVFFALHFLGNPENIDVDAKLSPTKTDESEKIVFTYKNKVQAHLHVSFSEDLPCEAYIYGTKGTIKIHRMWHCPSQISLIFETEEIDVTPHYIGNGYNYEIQEVNSCLQNALTQSNIFTLDQSLDLMKILDKISKKWQ